MDQISMLMRVVGATALALIWSLGAVVEASATLFTIDKSGDGILQLDGSDDLPFGFTGTVAGVNGGVVDGIIHAVDIFSITAAEIFSSVGSVDWASQDVFIVDIELLSPSAPVDQIGIGIGSIPLFGNPVGAGTLTGAGQAPSAVSVSPFVTFRADFDFDLGGLSAANLETGETSVRVFVTYAPGGGALAIGQTVNFMISSGTDMTFMTTIVPEPSTVLLLGAGIAAIAGSQRLRKGR